MPATKPPETVQLVFNMELLAISSMSEIRSENIVCFRVFEQKINHLRSMTSDRQVLNLILVQKVSFSIIVDIRIMSPPQYVNQDKSKCKA